MPAPLRHNREKAGIEGLHETSIDWSEGETVEFDCELRARKFRSGTEVREGCGASHGGIAVGDARNRMALALIGSENVLRGRKGRDANGRERTGQDTT